MFITKKHISRRTVLKGMGVTVALPLLDAMVPARHGVREDARRPRRRRGSSASRWCTARPAARRSACKKNLWAPAEVGPRLRSRRRAPRAARAVPRVPDDRQQHRRAQRRGVHAAGNRRRSLPLERGVPDAVASEADRRAPTCYVGTSLDQIYAQRFGQDTPIPSMQLCIENVDQAGGCAYGYSCVYTDTISWASPTEPLPMIRDPRVVVRSAVRRRRDAGRARRATAATDRSILDWVTGEVGAHRRGPRRRRSRAASTTTSTTSARSSAAFSASRRATRAASRASCRARRSACPTRSTSTSS